MSSPKPEEEKLLEPVEQLLEKLANQINHQSFEFRLQALEATASRLGGFSLKDYYKAFDIKPVANCVLLDKAGEELAQALSSISIHPSLALSALAREPLVKTVKRASGAYHTDFRLAKYIAELGKSALTENAKVFDPACGAGILLVATSIYTCGADRRKAAGWLANSVYAADLSEAALRGTRLALASLTDDLDAILSMWSHWRCQDSLTMSEEEYEDFAPGGFDLVVGNPPWEKVKLTRHEYLQAQGAERHYGADYNKINKEHFHQEKNSVAEYAQQLIERYSLLGSGEPDLYMAFLQLSSRLVKPGGRVAILLPAGLIRSSGTEALRNLLFNSVSNLSFTVMDNRAKFFAIDTRFKFLAMSYVRLAEGKKLINDPIRLCHANGTLEGVKQTAYTRMGRRTLLKVRPDLSIPEVRNKKEWSVFLSMAQHGVNWSIKTSKWNPKIVREIDMTRERGNFFRESRYRAIPVVEGRMVQAHRFGAKVYEFGSGRRAIWSTLPMGHSQVGPQFWLDSESLSKNVFERSQSTRAGFCDIAGQTNERSMTAALIPPGVVCGNKVPTITFPNDPSEKRLLLWVGIVNSLPFDWMIRRVLTTTVNYFLLLGLPLPQLEPDSLVGRRLIDATRKLRALDTAGLVFDPWQMAKLRADIDLSVLTGYGLNYEDLDLMLGDFPLLDRGQPTIYGEKVSTITRDYLLLRAAKRYKHPLKELQKRVDAAKHVGALPYVPSETMASLFSEKNSLQVDKK